MHEAARQQEKAAKERAWEERAEQEARRRLGGFKTEAEQRRFLEARRKNGHSTCAVRVKSTWHMHE